MKESLKLINNLYSKGYDLGKLVSLASDTHPSRKTYETNWDVASLYWQVMPMHQVSTSDYQNRVVATNKNINRFKNKEIPSNTKGVEGTPSWSLLNKIK